MQSKQPEIGEAATAKSAETLALRVFDWVYNCCLILLLTFLENIRLKTEIVALRDKVKELKEENQKLYESSYLDSSTSGIPSSKCWKENGVTDECGEADDSAASQSGDGKKETPTSVTGYINGKAVKKRERGGQEGHAPAFMHIDDVQEEETVLHYPNECTNCPHLNQCLEEGRFRKHHTSYGYDIKIIRIRRKHVLFKVTECPNNGHPIHDSFPEIKGSQFYDTTIQLHVLTWHHIFNGSYARIALAAKELFGLSLGAGTANAIVKRTSARILDSGFMDAVRFFILLFETLLGVDETSACVNGRNAWVHTAVTANVTLLSAHWRRGYEGVIYAGVLQFFTKTLLSDCWASYFNEVFTFDHALCNGHILRELVAAAYFRQQIWAIEMFDLLLEVLTAKRDAVERGEKSLSQEYINEIRARYRQIVEDGFNENIGVTKGKTFSLLERLRKHEDSVLAFAVDFSVDFTNNASEQSLRNLKVTLRVISQFKTITGLADYCIIQSFMDTCRKQGHNPYDMMRIVLSGGDIIEAVFGTDKAPLLKQMIRLADAFAANDSNEVDAAISDIQTPPTEQLIEAASYGRYKVYDEPPPEKKNSSSAIPKDKMQAARENNSRKKSDPAATPSVQKAQDKSENLSLNNSRKTRAGPTSA